MKIFFIVIIVILSFSFAFAQEIPESVIKKYNLNENSTFFEIKKAMNSYWESTGVDGGYRYKSGQKEKAAGWKLYKRWEYYWEQRVDQKTGKFPTKTAIEEAYSKRMDINQENDFSENWVSLGTNFSSGGYAGIGRINCIAFHPSDANTYWVGSPSGGIWKTTNNGTNWTILNNNLSVIGVSDIAVPSDFATSNTIYIATGDRDGGSMWSLNGGQNNDNNTIGVLKSTDDGNNWFATGLTFTISQNKMVFRLLIHPTNSQILIAATSDGIYKTTDGGTSWTKKEGNMWKDMEFNPGDPNIIYASSAVYSGVYINKSTNGGENWTFALINASGRRGELAVSSNNPSVVYMLISNSSQYLLGVFKSTNNGASFSQVNTNVTQNMLGYYSNGLGTDGQGSYDLCIAASPTDANTVFLGGINTWKSTDGGVNWTICNMWTSHPSYNFVNAPVAHADKHVLAFQSGSVLFEGNDGGIYKTTNGGSSWIDRSNGLVISQIYRISVSQNSVNKVMTGLQDNGSKLFNNSLWTDVTGGDGMECIIDYSSDTYMYATYVRGEIYRSSNGGVSFPVTISNNISPVPTGAWVTPYIMDPLTSTTLYAGYDKVWKTTNRGDSWTTISQVLSSSDKLRSLAAAPSNPSILFTADRTNLWKTTDGGATDWTIVTQPATSNFLTYITVKNNDPNTLWITYGGYDANRVFESTNGGSNWTNISSGLPNIPIMCIVYYKSATDRNVLFAGTDVGVYVKDGSSNWVLYSNGLPNVVVTELDIYYNASGNKLRAATFGRGLWETTIEAALPVEISSLSGFVEKNSVTISWNTTLEINNKGFEIERMTQGSGIWQKVGFVQGHGNSNNIIHYSFTDYKLSSGSYKYRIKQIDYNGNHQYHLMNSSFTVGVPESYFISQNYPNPFNATTKIEYGIPNDSKVKIVVFNQLGQEVVTLVNQFQRAGFYSFQFKADNLPTGVYYCKITSNEFSDVKKLLLLK